MGNLVGIIRRKAMKPIRDYNFEARVEKVIIKDKQVAAPHHYGTDYPMERLSSDEREVMKKKINEVDSKLLERLRHVYVTSHGDNPHTNDADLKRSLPQDREQHEEPLYGYHERKGRSYGKISLKDALILVSKNQEDSEKWTPVVLAQEYKLDSIRTEEVVKYFRTFTLVLPADSDLDVGKSVPLLVGARNVMKLPMPDKNSVQDNPTVAS